MFKSALYQLFVPMGRTRPRTFWTWLAVFAVLVVSFQWGLLQHDTGGAFYFWGYLTFMVMLFCGVFGIYGKRLKDFGRSVGWVILAITLILLVLMAAVLVYGGADYFAEYSQYERKAAIDPAVRERLNADFERELAGSGRFVAIGTGAIMVLFTLWVGLTRGDAGDNRYGPAPKDAVADA